MPTRPEGVYRDEHGGWYYKITVGRDPLTNRRRQVTRRGFATAGEAGKARRALLAKSDAGLVRPGPKGLTVKALMDTYLDGLDAQAPLVNNANL